MEYLKEADVLCDEELRGRIIEEESVINKATILFRENIKLVYHVAKKFRNSCGDNAVDFDDILSTGYEGLWRACLKFDESKGFQFSTYAYTWIQGCILRMLRDTESIQTPRWYKDIKYAISSRGYELPLTESQIQVILGEGKATREQIEDYQELYVSSIDFTISEDGDTMLELIKDDSIPEVSESLSEDELESAIDRILDSIGRLRNRDLIEEWLYSILYDDKVNQRTLAQKYNIQQPAVSRQIMRAQRLMTEHADEIKQLLAVV